MRVSTQRALVLALIAFVAAVANARGGSAPLFAQETSLCNASNTGAKCGTKYHCSSWRLESGEISTTGGGVGTTCSSYTVTDLYKYVEQPYCMQCHYPIGGGGGTGGGTSGGAAGGGSGSGDDCGDPDLWSDDGSKCDQDSQSH